MWVTVAFGAIDRGIQLQQQNKGVFFSGVRILPHRRTGSCNLSCVLVLTQSKPEGPQKPDMIASNQVGKNLVKYQGDRKRTVLI